MIEKEKGRRLLVQEEEVDEREEGGNAHHIHFGGNAHHIPFSAGDELHSSPDEDVGLVWLCRFRIHLGG